METLPASTSRRFRHCCWRPGGDKAPMRGRDVEALFSRRPGLQPSSMRRRGQDRSGAIDPLAYKSCSASRYSARTRVAKLFAESKLARRLDVVAAITGAFRTGRSVRQGGVQKECSVCHQLEGVGNQIGPPERHPRPNERGHPAQYPRPQSRRQTAIPQLFLVTNAGRTLTGMITTETANGITFAAPTAQ